MGPAMATLAHITDLHLRPPGVLTLGRIDADRFAARAIDRIIAAHPDIDAVIVSGDLADIGEAAAYARAAMLLSRFSVPVLVVPGNHDRTGPLIDEFIAWPGVSARPLAGKLCYAVEVDGVRVVMLDTSVDGMDRREQHGLLGEAQLAWLDETLGDDVPTLIAMHHPPFPVGIGFMDGITLRDSEAFAAVVARHTSVKRIVCGHVHRTIVSEVGGVPAVAVPGVAHQVQLALDADAPARLVMEPPAYAIHLVGEGQTISHIGYVDDYGEPQAFADLKRVTEPAQ